MRRGHRARGGGLWAAALVTSLGAAAGAAPASAQDRGLQALLDQASHWRSQSNPAQAMRVLERVLHANPSHPEALAAAAELRLEAGDHPGAEGFLQRLRQAAPGHARVAELDLALRTPLPDATARAAAQAAGRERGFAALNAGRLAEAAAEFERLTARDPGDADALGGLGLVRLRGGRDAEAARLLAQAVEADPAEGTRKWGMALNSAAFGAELAAARGHLSAGAPDAAEALLLRAVRRDTPERAEAETLLGEIAARRGDLVAAETHFRTALLSRPMLGPAMTGLHAVMRQAGRHAEAQALAARAAGGQARADALRAEALRTEAPVAAIALLRSAAEAAPSDVWAKLDLARLLARDGRAEEGRALLEARADTADAIHAAALFAAGTGRPAEAVALLGRLPDRLRTAEQSQLLRAARLAALTAFLSEGRPEEARQRLVALAARPDPGAETVVGAVRALLALGDRAGAVEAARAAAGMNRSASPAWRLAVSATLKDAGLDADAAAFTVNLAADPRMTSADARLMAALAGTTVPLRPVEPASAVAAAQPQPLAQERTRDPREVLRIAEAVLRRDPRNAEARLGAAEAALVLGDARGAEALLANGRAYMPNDPRLSVMDARVARAAGDTRRAQASLRVAAEQRRSQIGLDRGATLASADPGYRRTPLAGDGQGASFAPLDSNPGSAANATAGAGFQSTDPLLNEIGRQLAEVNEEASVRVTANGTFRSRSGSQGLERLTEYGGGAEATAPLPGLGGQVAVRAQAVHLESGRLDPNNTFDLRRFGTNATVVTGAGVTAGASADSLRPRDTQATGVSLGVAYLRDGLTVDIGSTPIGFREQNIVGGIELSPQIDENLRLRLRGERRAVTDSVLSWAGMRDTLTGRRFGGVTRNTGYGQIEYQVGDVGLYAGGGYSYFEGNNVADNHRWEAGAGVNYAIFRRPTQELVTGLDLLYLSYDRNLRLFSFGHGGYFSPQSYFVASVPLDYRGREGNLAYRIGASAGVASFRERRAPFFPNDPALQQVVEAQAAADPTVTAFYPGQNRTVFAGSVRGDIEYAITPSLRVGALARYERSADYNEFRGMIYARYRFD